jgi:3-deoxy-D-arabino-heptulosonate 7-phosphate (DAHP) synthase class II
MGNGHLPRLLWHAVCFFLEVVSNMRPYIREPAGQETVPMATSHELTLLDVIQAVSEVAENNQEIVATVTHLICSGQVRLRNDAIETIRHLFATVDAAA